MMSAMVVSIDIISSDANERVQLVKLAFELGWSVGISNKGFIHLDMRTLRGDPQVIFWILKKGVSPFFIRQKFLC